MAVLAEGELSFLFTEGDFVTIEVVDALPGVADSNDEAGPSLFILLDFEAVAQRVMKKTAWAYYSSAADDEIVSQLRCPLLNTPSFRVFAPFIVSFPRVSVPLGAPHVD